MKNKNIIRNFAIGFAFIWSISLLFGIIAYSILVKSVAYVPFLIMLGVVFGLSYHFKNKYNPEIRYFLIAYALLITLILIIYSEDLFTMLFLLSFSFFPAIFIFDIGKFIKKQRLFVKTLIYIAYIILFLIDGFIMEDLLMEENRLYRRLR